MADEDEVDILGDFSLDNLLTKTDTNIYSSTSLVSQNMDILGDYGMLGTSWYTNEAAEGFSVDLPHSDFDFGQQKEETLACTENLVNDESGWTEKEKSLLTRGIEIFGKSSLRLSQFIGSKTPSEVRYYFKHFYSDVQLSYNISEDVGLDEIALNSDILGETQIPASIEEVIQADSTTKDRTEDVVSDVGYRNKSPVKRKVKEKTGRGAKFREKFDSGSEEKFENDIQKTVAEIVTGKGLSVPMCDGEEMVKITKEGTDGESESDVEIDIENDETPKPLAKKLQQPHEHKPPQFNNSQTNVPHEQTFNLSECGEIVKNQLTTLEQPNEELILDPNSISELEKVVHGDFFEGRAAKTPSRYLKIRNHIINAWLSTKPDYITKTSTRQGLKNCGDVNCIGRIHTFLEQIGAINFGCPQISYIRPLSHMLQTACREKDKKAVTACVTDLTTRPRIKKKFNSDGEGGCTLTHGEQGEIINTLVVSEAPPVKKICTKKPVVKLIYCRPFPENDPQKYKVNLDLSTLILMDLHSHMSLTEVMGLVGGIWNPEKKTLIILHYEPCRNVASSTIHCDMCPISQANAADIIHSKGLSILGWFHSHPTFAPEPSQQDLDTQLSVQQWIGSDKPCIGVILSPFSLQGALIASPYRCLVVRKKVSFEDQFVPFKFKVDVLSEDVSVGNLLKNARKIVGFCQEGVLSKTYFLDQNLTYLDKFISSVRMHLAKCGKVNKMTCDEIVHGLVELTK